MVLFNYAPSAPGSARLRRLATALSGREGALPDCYGLSAEQLAALLNAYKEAARSGLNKLPHATGPA
jgi:hypothetical protein